MPPLYAKCGFSGKTPQALLFAPLEYGGGGFVQWDVLQGEGQIIQFSKHWRTDTEISTTLRINLAWCQWQAGTSTSILRSTDPNTLQYLKARWLPSMHSTLHQFGAKMVVDDDFVPHPERGKDQYIMEVAMQLSQFNDKDLLIINFCQLYLHVTTISEMLDTTGETIVPHIKRCERALWFNPTVNVTIQKRPSDYQIRTRWQPLCAHIATLLSSAGPWHLPLRLRCESYCLNTDNNIRKFYHWHCS